MGTVRIVGIILGTITKYIFVIYLPPFEVVSSDVFALFKMLEDGEASHGDGTNFCQASFLGCVGVMISLFKDFKSGLGDISDN